jgi:hypothetical protein
MFRLIAALALCMALAACTSCSTIEHTIGYNQSEVKTVELSCTAAATALDTLTAANNAHKLSAAQQATVGQAASQVGLVCSRSRATPPSAAELASYAFQTATGYLLTAAAPFKGN